MSDFGPKEILSRIRVRTGSLAAAAVVLLATPNWASILIGVSISVLGLAIRTWASGHLRKEKRLTVSGPYRYSRNPLYLGNFILGAGIAAGSRSWWIVWLFIVYFAVFYPLIIVQERKRMKELFPIQYEEYRKKVPLFFPSPLRCNHASREKFSWALYKQNKEYRALIATVALWLTLAGKVLLLNR
ncbi:MAG: isoprenylcysteine carboxylmethyltransferase family protein [Clostridiales bacterium]|nr:isoprenylcysteine carboxylmethyltransferase family protein [Clostridiales bacterium]